MTKKKTRTGKTAAAASILDKYEGLKRVLGHAECTTLIAEIVSDCAFFLADETRTLPLKSLVEGKRYFAFQDKDEKARTSRPINEELYIADAQELSRQLEKLKANPALHWLSVDKCNRFLYTLAMSFCAFNDVTSDRDKKTPGTYFELLVGHLLALTFGVQPRNRVEVLTVEDERSTLPTDFIFDLGPRQLKFHVPVKISTRGWVAQAWAHQCVLNGVYGEGRFKGVLVALPETKLDLQKLEVVEICLPDQWAVYQRFVARMDRIYYLDLPAKYAALATAFPYIPVKTFGEFFAEREALIRQPGQPRTTRRIAV
jgi:hypothetical protein